MFDVFFTLRSVTRGQRGSEALRRAGVESRLLRAPREIAPEGCGYALAVRSRDWVRGLRVLEAAGLGTEGQFRRLRDGGFERLRP